MGRFKLNQKGFSAVVVLLALLLVVAVGFTGYYVYSNQKKLNTTAQTTDQDSRGTNTNQSPTETKENTITDSKKAGWKTYTNSVYGYSFDFPGQAMSGSCQSTTTGYDNYGNTITLLPEHYTTKSSTANTTIIDSATSGKIYVTVDKTILLSDTKKSSNYPDRDIYTSCKEISASSKNLDESKTSNTLDTYYFNNIDVTFAKTDAAGITKVLQENYPDSEVSSVSLGTLTDGGKQTVTPNKGLTNGLVKVVYLPKTKTLAIWSLGQSCHLMQGDSCKDEEISNSLKSL